MTKTNAHSANVQAYLNICAAIGERMHMIRRIEADHEEAFKKADEYKKKADESEKEAIEAFRAEAEKEAE